MKCQECGKEAGAGMACKNCGKEAGPPKAVEVEYKNFKISELLDIKMSRHISSGKSTNKQGPMLAKAVRRERSLPVGHKTPGVRSLLVLTTVIVVLVLIAGFYLLKSVIRF